MPVLTGLPARSYLGVEAATPPNMFILQRDPTQNDNRNVYVGDYWLNPDPAGQSLWVLISLGTSVTPNVATWVQLYPQGSGGATQFVANVGVANEVGGIINILGDTLDTLTTGAGNTITITHSGTQVKQVTTDSGVAIPVGSNLNIFGGNLITTTGVSDTVTVEMTQGLDGQVPIAATGLAPIWANITSADGSVDIVNGPNTIDISVSQSGASKTTIFNASGTWTKDVDTNYISVFVWSGGGGGGSGHRGTSGGFTGGGGGAPNGFCCISGPALFFGATEPVTIGAGGTGGAAILTDNTNGISGLAGGLSSFGALSTITAGITNGGSGGFSGGLLNRTVNASGGSYLPYGMQLSSFSGGNNFAVSEAIGGFGARTAGGTGGANRVTGFPGPNIAFGGAYSPTGGGGGSGADTVTIYAGGDGGPSLDLAGTTIQIAGGVGGIESGTINGGNGNPSGTNGGIPTGGTGGGGGGGQSAGLVAGNGGVGGIPGGGGGGGGASLNGTPSGAGGDGGQGQVIVVEFF